MRRRELLATAGTAVTGALAGCNVLAGGVNCSKFAPSGKKTQVAKASMEALFMHTEESAAGVDSSAVRAAQNDIKPARRIRDTVVIPNPGNAYSGFLVREDNSKKAVAKAFKRAGIELKGKWWSFQPPGSWPVTIEKIHARRDAVEGKFDVETTLPVDFEMTSASGQPGHRAAFAFSPDATKKEMQNTVYAMGRSGGMAFEPMTPTGPAPVTYIGTQGSLKDVTVRETDGGEFEIRVTPHPVVVRTFLEDVGRDLESIALWVPGNAKPAIDLSEGVPADPVATDLVDEWWEAYATATALLHPIENPVYARLPGGTCSG